MGTGVESFASIKKAGNFPGFKIGGGEIRTLVLGKHPMNDYMLSTFVI